MTMTRLGVSLSAIAALAFAAVTACGSTSEPATRTTPSQVATGESSSTTSPSGDSAPDSTEASAPSPSNPAGSEISPKVFLERLKAGMQGKLTYHIDMTMTGPESIRITGDADMTNPRGKNMTVEMSGSGVPGTVRMRMVDDVGYMSVPGLTPAGKYIKVDPNNPNDRLGVGMKQSLRSGGLDSTFDAFNAGLMKVVDQGSDTVDGEQLRKYVLTVDAAKAMAAQNKAMVPNLPATLEYELWLDDQDLMRQVTFGMKGIRGVAKVSKWGEPVNIIAPPLDSLVPAP